MASWRPSRRSGVIKPYIKNRRPRVRVGWEPGGGDASVTGGRSVAYLWVVLSKPGQLDSMSLSEIGEASEEDRLVSVGDTAGSACD